MKNISVILLFSLSLLLISCSDTSDDNFNPTNNNGNSNTSGNNHNGNNNNGNNSTNNPTGQEGEITLYSVQGEDISKIVDYQVSGLNLIYQQDIQEHQRLWRLIKKIIPLNYRSKIGEFLIYNGTITDTFGLSEKINNDASKWRIGIAINYADDDQQKLIFTILHEFAHILTLNNDHIDTMVRESNCVNYFNNLGCSNNNSYINQFQSQFWTDIWSDYLVSKNGTQIEMLSFYNFYSDHFFLPNSAISPEEDIADVFATFVLREEGATGNSIAEQKIEFMYTYNELVSLRNYARTNLGS